MKRKHKFDIEPDVNSIQRVIMNPICVQDTTHIGTKMRNRLLNSSILLQIGNGVASIIHIKFLIDNVPKEEHGLVYSDIFPEDRQNFRSLEKIMNSRVITALKCHVADCESTLIYLKLCHEITTSFIQKEMQPIERIQKIWYAVYFLRIWRKWIQSNENRNTLSDNFISSNAYACIEINAHALVELIVRLRPSKLQHLFLTPYFSSQPCESMFRKFRSMGTCNFTKINFNINELLNMNARVELMNKIIHSCDEIVSPRNQGKMDPQPATDLPSDEEIINAMKKSLALALEDAEKLNMHSTFADIIKCDDQLYNESISEDINNLIADLSDEEVEDDPKSDRCLGPNSNTVEVVDSDGNASTIPKSTLIWMLTDSKQRVSSDRLNRVKDSSNPSTSGVKKFKSGSFWNDNKNVYKSEEIRIGEWAILE